jgi:hypothetical protein
LPTPAKHRRFPRRSRRTDGLAPSAPRFDRSVDCGLCLGGPNGQFHDLFAIRHARFGHDASGAAAGLNIQLPVIPKYSLLVECNPPLRGEIGGDARALGDPVVQRDNARDRLFQALHRLREGSEGLRRSERATGRHRRACGQGNMCPRCGPARPRNSPGISVPDISGNRLHAVSLRCVGPRSRACLRSGDGCRGSRPRGRRW